MNTLPLLAELRLAPRDGTGVKFVAPSDTLPEASADQEVLLEWPLALQPGDWKWKWLF
jgi:hypothetical protein